MLARIGAVGPTVDAIHLGRAHGTRSDKDLVWEIVARGRTTRPPRAAQPLPSPARRAKRELLDWCAWSVHAQQGSAEPVALPA